MARQGRARHGNARSGPDGQGWAWLGVAWRGKAWHGEAGHGWARLGAAGPGGARLGQARHGAAWPGAAWQGKALQGAAWNGVAGQGKATFFKEQRMKSIKSDTRLKTISRKVTLEGLRPIMFDRYPGDNDTKLQWTQKIYLIPGTNVLCLPAININSFLTAHNTPSAPKRLRDKRKYKDLCNAIQSFTMLEAITGDPEYLPFTREGNVIEVGEFDQAKDESSGLFLHRAVARLDKGIPNPKERPVLPLPWELSFKLIIMQNDAVKEEEIKNLFIEGGVAIGLGTYRGQFGKFVVSDWS